MKNKNLTIPEGFQDMLSFPPLEALWGRRSRQFTRAEIPDGVFPDDGRL